MMTETTEVVGWARSGEVFFGPPAKAVTVAVSEKAKSTAKRDTECERFMAGIPWILYVPYFSYEQLAASNFQSCRLFGDYEDFAQVRNYAPCSLLSIRPWGYYPKGVVWRGIRAGRCLYPPTPVPSLNGLTPHPQRGRLRPHPRHQPRYRRTPRRRGPHLRYLNGQRTRVRRRDRGRTRAHYTRRRLPHRAHRRYTALDTGDHFHPHRPGRQKLSPVAGWVLPRRYARQNQRSRYSPRSYRPDRADPADGYRPHSSRHPQAHPHSAHRRTRSTRS